MLSFMSSKELQRRCDEQHKQILLYEKKLKDVVKAYKSLEAEKNALQSVVGSLGGGEEKEGGEGAGGGESVEQPPGDDATVDNLKKSLAILTKEKTRRETAFQNDKRALMAENDSLKEKLKKAADEAEQQAEKVEKIIRDLSEKVRRISADREKELTDHGSVLAEMQQQYAKEKANSEQLHKQLAEVYTRLKSHDDAPAKYAEKEKEGAEERDKLVREVEKWKRKAERTPTVQLLSDQIKNLKEEHERALSEARLADSNRTGEAGGEEAQKLRERVEQLEERVMSVCARSAEAERERADAEERAAKARQELLHMNELMSRVPTTTAPAVDRLKEAAEELHRRGEDVGKLLGLSPSSDSSLVERHAALEEEFERYKLKVEAVLRNKQSSPTSTASREEESLRGMVAQLHGKLRNAETAHMADQREAEELLRVLRERLSDQQREADQKRADMLAEHMHKVSELEGEMARQRTRTLDMLAEKEHELEVTRSILVSMRGDQLSCSVGGAPADPPPPGKISAGKRKSSELRRYAERKSSAGSRHRGSMDGRDSVSSLADLSLGHAVPMTAIRMRTNGHGISLPTTNESRNMFYEDELAKRERELVEMRNTVHQLDFRLREMEQNQLCKDLQQLEMNEKLKEEIRVLEGKLRLLSQEGSSSDNLEYLRNIFVQFLSCDSVSARRNILRAMSTVLRLSANEMKMVDKCK